MRKPLRLLFLLLFIAVPSLWACDITVVPSKKDVLVGDTLKVLVHVHLIHRKCVLPIEETEVEATNGVVLSHTPWKKTARMDRESVYTIVFKRAGRNRILVTRECSRVGLSEGQSYVNVSYDRERAIQTAKQLLDEIASGKRVRSNSEALMDIASWIDSRKKSDKKLMELSEGIKSLAAI